jgi:opacity protein-like surface antigen
MKNIFLIVIFSCLTIVTTEAQSTDFFGTLGFSNGRAKVEEGSSSAIGTDSGFYVGVGAIFGLAEKSDLLVELSYMNIGDTNYIQLPALFSYELAKSFSILAGPQLVYVAEESFPEVTNFSLGLTAGLRYDISEKAFLLARYMFQVTNTYTGPLDITARTNFLNFGVGYKF